MCFSATASFASSAVLATFGFATLTQVKRKHEIPLALIPVFFAVQQFFEGWVWLNIPLEGREFFWAYGFLFFAFILWPFYFPSASFFLEQKGWRKGLQLFTWGVGCMIALYLGLHLFTKPLEVSVVNQCLRYQMEIPFTKLGDVIYLFTVALPGLVSSHKVLRIFSVVLIASFVFSQWLYAQTFPSVWCFFAAVLSLILLAYFYPNLFKRKVKEKPL